MRTDLTAPCVDCPFRRDGSGVNLRPARIVEIHAVVSRGGGFPCHRTVEHYDGDDVEEEAIAPPRGHKLQQCAGAMAYALNCGDPLAATVVQIRVSCDSAKIAALEEARTIIYGGLDEWRRKGSI